MKTIYFFFLTVAVCSSCVSNKQLRISPSLESNSEKWRAQIRYKMVGFSRASFGPYQTIEAIQLDSPRYKNKTVDPGIFSRRSVTKEQQKFYHLKVASDSDSMEILFSVLLSSVSEQPSLLRQLRGKDQPEDYKTEQLPKSVSGSIIVEKKSPDWIFNVKWFPPQLAYSAEASERYLTNGRDTFYAIVPPVIIEPRRSLFLAYHIQSSFVSGFVLQNNRGEEVAAVQFSKKEQVWVNRALAKESQMAISAFFLIFLSAAYL